MASTLRICFFVSVFACFCRIAAQQPEDPTQRTQEQIFSKTLKLKSKEGFGAEMWLVANQQFFADWMKPDIPRFSPVETVHRRQEVYVAIMFVNPGKDGDGNAWVTYDLKIERPDGKVYYDEPDITAWEKEAPARGLIQLAQGIPSIKVDPWDPLGKYVIRVVVRDRVKNIEIPLEVSFTAQE